MPTMQQSIIALHSTFPDLAANVSLTQIPTFLGLPDGADVLGQVMPFAGTIVGIAVASDLAGADTITITPQIAATPKMTSPSQCASLSTQISSGAKAATTVVSKDQADCQFAAGQCIGLSYLTSAAITVKDVLVTLYISTGRTDI